MTFQSTVNRNFATGIFGEVLNDGPIRATVARIASTFNDTAGNPQNVISRAFGYSADIGPVGPSSGGGPTYAAQEQSVTVGGANFVGILGNPKRYASYGTAAGGSLAPTLALPQYAEGEFYDMAIMFLQLYNTTTSTINVPMNDGIGYVNNMTNNAQNLSLGMLVPLAQFAGSVPSWVTTIPGALVRNPISLAASASGALVSGGTRCQLTQ